MAFYFIHHSFLFLLPFCAAGFLTLRARRRPGDVIGATCAAVALMCLIFAAAGLGFRQSVRKNQLVVAVDLSDSMTDQTDRIRELLTALDPDSTDVAFTVFGRTQGLERPMVPLRSIVTATGLALPDFSRPTSVIDPGATDLVGAMQFGRSVFPPGDAARAILLLSDFRDTKNPPLNIAATAAALNASGIRVLATPAILSASNDVQLSELRAPDEVLSTRSIPLDISICGQKETTVKVRVTRAAPGRQPVFVGAATVKLAPKPNAKTGPDTILRESIRILDVPQPPGVALYTATLSGPEGPIPGDVLTNNALSAAVRIAGPSTWAVLTRPNSTLARLASDSSKPLGTDAEVFVPGKFPADATRYDRFSGIVIDGLSAEELPDNSASLRALEAAINGGKALVALGGPNAFGAGGHPRGETFEKLLPVELTPQDDRARSVLFLLDVSRSMDERFSPNGGPRVRKLDHAASQLLAVQKLRPQDRLGLIEFSGTARVASALSPEPTRAAFLDAARALKIDNNTDLLQPLELAKKLLDADDAEEQWVILISDGIQTITRPREEILKAAEALCPKTANQAKRRTTLWTFGIGVQKSDSNPVGEALLKDLAVAGAGSYSPDFLNLGEQLSKAFEEGQKDFFTRRTAFTPRPASGAPSALFNQNSPWPELHFLNRVKAKPGADVSLWSRAALEADTKTKSRPDPLVILSGPGDDALSRRAALALSLDGPDGEILLSPNSAGRSLLSNLMSWSESKKSDGSSFVTLTTAPSGDDALSIELRVNDPTTSAPLSMLKPTGLLTVLLPADASTKPVAPFALKAEAPGVYRAHIDAPPASVCRLTVSENARVIAERFVSTPCSAERRRFGVDRAAMSEQIAKSGHDARAIESPRDLAAWAAAQSTSAGGYDLGAWLLSGALIFLLASWYSRVGFNGKNH